MLTPDQIQSLAGLSKDKMVFSDRSRLIAYEQDAGLIKGTPQLVAIPTSVAEVQELVRWSHEQHVPITGRGAGTGYTGGAIPIQGGMVVAFSRMNQVLEVDELGMQARLQPGVVNIDFQRHLAPLSLSYPPDPSSYTVCTIGGNIAENAGGPHCLKYGITRNYLLGLEAVLADGSLVTFGGKALDWPEYDFVSLLTGSEGTLALITAATVQLCRLPQDVKALTASFDTVEQAAQAVSAMIGSGYLPATLEFMDNSMIRLVESLLQAGLPTEAGAMLILDVEGYPQSLAPQLNEIAAKLEKFDAKNIKVAQTATERDQLWSGRRNAGGAIARISPDEYLLDVSVPRSKLAKALRAITQLSTQHGFQVTYLAHIGDGNFHPSLLCDFSVPGQFEHVQEVGAEILNLCAQMGGSIGGEHGVGIEKREALTSMYSQEEIGAMLDVKQVFDPDQRLNPGKMFPEESKPGVCVERIHQSIAGSPWVPTTALEAADILYLNQSKGQPVYIRGGGSQWSGDGAQKDYLFTSGLKGIVKLAADDLYVVALPGTPLVELQNTLGESGFWLPAESPWQHTTLGGLVAANLNSPLRRRYGALREWLLAAQVAFPDGRLLRFGRPLVKDIAGYDLARLYVGSFGSLGLLTEMTLKISPLPRGRRSLCVTTPDVQTALQWASVAMHNSLINSGLLLSSADDAYTLTCTAEGHPLDVDAELDTIRHLWAGNGANHVQVTDQVSAVSTWQNALSSAAWTARMGVPPGSLPVLFENIEKTHLHRPTVVDVSNGLMYLASQEDDAGRAAQTLEDWRNAVAERQGYTLMMSGPRRWLTQIDVWGAPRQSQPLMQTLKRRWDPAGILNPAEFNHL